MTQYVGMSLIAIDMPTCNHALQSSSLDAITSNDFDDEIIWKRRALPTSGCMTIAFSSSVRW